MKSPLDASKLESLFLRFFANNAIKENKPITRRVLRQKLRSIERGVIIRGTIAGFLSGAAAATSVYFAERTHQDLAAQFHWSHTFAFYFMAMGLTAIFTVMEILFLYVDGVKACASMSKVAQNNFLMKIEDVEALNRTLVQAGLEIPDSRDPLYGIDPLFNRSPLRIFLFSIIYKLKVSASNAILKFALKRFFPKLAGRTFGRSLIEIISAPVFALWNFFLCRLIMKRARIRTLGPLLIEDVINTFWPQGIHQTTSKELQLAFSALKETVILCGYFHYNHILFAQEIVHVAGTTDINPLPLKDIFETLPEKQRFHSLKLLALLLVIDGKWSKSKSDLLLTLHQYAAPQCPMPDLKQIYQAVCEGEAIPL